MKTTIKILVLEVLLLGLLTTACTKEGPQGPIGPVGPEGVQGDEGPQGDEGTANVMYSDWLDQNINFLDFSTSKSMRVNEPRLTPDFLNNGGIVLGFYRSLETSHYMLPYISPFGDNMRSMQILIFDGSGEIRFHIYSTDGTLLTDHEVNGAGMNEQVQYKYVMIPGGLNITGKSQQPNFKKMTYYEIMDYFGLTY